MSSPANSDSLLPPDVDRCARFNVLDQFNSRDVQNGADAYRFGAFSILPMRSFREKPVLGF